MKFNELLAGMLRKFAGVDVSRITAEHAIRNKPTNSNQWISRPETVGEGQTNIWRKRKFDLALQQN